MKEPQFKIGDKVWILWENGIHEVKISGIRQTWDGEIEHKEYYDFEIWLPPMDFSKPTRLTLWVEQWKRTRLFLTKQDLLNSL
jgi:hypothetical protein